jgi:hypothetical protein
LMRASELAYIGGHRLDASATEIWRLGAWELWALGSLRYNAEGVELVALDAAAYPACSPNCAARPYHNPFGYWSPSLGAGASWALTPALRLLGNGRLEYRGYLDPSGIEGVASSRKLRRDARLRARIGGELGLDDNGTFRLTVDQTLLLSSSNVAFDASSASHAADYGNHSFIEATLEVGVAALF